MTPYKFGRFRFDAATGVLLVAGRPVDIGKRGALLLRHLLEHRGAVVSKYALIDAGWGNSVVEASNLSVQVARLRRLLGTSPAWIETVGRIGYRFRQDAADAAVPVAMTPALLLLPVAGLDDGGRELAASVTDDLAIALSRFKSLAVVTVQTRDAAAPDRRRRARDTDARYVLQGSVRVRSGLVRIGMQLFAGSGDRILWGERFDKNATDPRAAAERLADVAAARVESEVQRIEIDRALRGMPQDTVAGLYRRGRALVLRALPDENAAGISLFERALELEPGNITLMAAACDARAVRISMGWPAVGDDDAAPCRLLARNGLAHAAGDADATSMFGYGLYRTGENDFGLAVVQRAVEANPNSVTALVLAGTANMHWGRISGAEAQYRRALKLAPNDPNQAQVMGGLSRIRMMQGRFEDALRWSERALAVNPNYGGAHWSRVAASANLGRMDEARHHLARFRRAQPDVTVASVRAAQPTRSGRMTATLEGLELAGLPLADAGAGGAALAG